MVDEKREPTATPATTVPLDPHNVAVERVDQLPTQPEPRIEDPASTISPNTATQFGGTTPLGPGAQRTMKAAIDLARRTEKERKKQKRVQAYINIGSPLNVKTKHGELQAGPGDVVMEIGGTKSIFSIEAFDELGEGNIKFDNYDDLLRETLKRGVIARRLDDGNRIPMTPEQEAEADKNIEEEVKNNREAREKLKKHKDKMKELFKVDPENPQAMNAVDSGEGPPTATPADTATLVPNFIPIEVLEQRDKDDDEPDSTVKSSPTNPNPTARPVPPQVKK